MTDAARRTLLIRDGLEAVREWESEQGALTAPECEKARRLVADELAAAPPAQSA